jgi:hypothetical protein
MFNIRNDDIWGNKLFDRRWEVMIIQNFDIDGEEVLFYLIDYK